MFQIRIVNSSKWLVSFSTSFNLQGLLPPVEREECPLQELVHSVFK